jgi:hypothetical protein
MATVKNSPKLLAAATNAHDLLVNVCEFLGNGTPIVNGSDMHADACVFRDQLFAAIGDADAEISRTDEVYLELLEACQDAFKFIRDEHGNGPTLRKLDKAIRAAIGGTT